MKTFLSRLLLLCAFMLAMVSNAEIYQDLHSFSLASGFPSSNTDGAVPESALVLSSNVHYGTTSQGGVNGDGVVYSIHADGTQFTNLHSFSPLSSGFIGYNTDGAAPYSTLILSSNVLYGTASQGGAGSGGSIFRMNTDGSDFTNLYSFPNFAGSPKAGVILSSNVLYGTSSTGGLNYGSVFRINTDGSHFTNLISFYPGATNAAFAPTGGLILSEATLYGTTAGSSGKSGGTIFSIGINGRGYTNLFYFQSVGGESQSSTNDTGGTPSDSLTLVGDTLFGVTPHGGTNGNGVIFAIKTNGMNFTNLHTFSQIDNTTGTNVEGYGPQCVLLPIGNTLYGTAASGGPTGYGTIFSINTDGSNFTVVYTFPDLLGPNYVDLDGSGPVGGLIVSGTTLYGTSTLGGGYNGNVYSYDLSPVVPPPVLTLLSSAFAVLSWDSTMYSLQSSTDLNAGFATVSASSPYDSIGGGSQQFFRLKHK